MASITPHASPSTLGTWLAQPCRNFNILGATTFQDPQDGREKVVLSTFAAGATGKLIFIDPDNGTGEAIPLPDDEGAWALYNLDNQRLLVGTCARAGYLHVLELADREWLTPLRDPHETYIWNLCRGSDGYIYGGTYPGCVLLRYDPRHHRLDNIGRASTNVRNLYSRYVYGDVPGSILIACGMDELHLTRYDLVSGEFTRFGPPHAQVKQITPDFLWVEHDWATTCYATQTLAEIPLAQAPLPAPPHIPYSGTRHEVSLRDGRSFATRGQEYYLHASTLRTGTLHTGTPHTVTSHTVQARPPLYAIPTERPPTRIHTLLSDAQGTLWGSSAFGQTIFSYDPDSGTLWNSHTVCDQGGEVYGMVFVDHRLFMAAYSGGDHVVFDPQAPWDQVTNVNPRTLQSVAPAYIRPEGRSVVGPDGHVWTGWMARYGLYGGAISRVNVATLEVTLWENLVSAQALMWIAADANYLYFTTGGAANGLPLKEEPFAFCVLSTAGEIVHQHTFAAGRKPGRIAAAAGSIYVAVDNELWPFTPSTLTWGQPHAVNAAITSLLPLAKGALLIFAGQNVWRLVGDQLVELGQLPGPVGAATQTPGGRVFVASGIDLYHLELAT
jgi:hypothetical protein